MGPEHERAVVWRRRDGGQGLALEGLSWWPVLTRLPPSGARWGNPNGAPFGRYPFGVAIEAEQTFADVTIGSALRAGWWWGTDRQPDGEFFRAQITGATFQ